MVDKVKPIKWETPAGGGTETDTAESEVNTLEDYVACKGIAFENSDNTRVESASGEAGWYDVGSSGFVAFNVAHNDYLDRLNGLMVAEAYTDASAGPFILQADHLIVMNDATLENISLIGFEDQS